MKKSKVVVKSAHQVSSRHAQPHAYRVVVIGESKRVTISEHDSFAAAETSRRLLPTTNGEEIRIESRALDGSYCVASEPRVASAVIEDSPAG
jgi:hypothetical protein